MKAYLDANNQLQFCIVSINKNTLQFLTLHFPSVTQPLLDRELFLDLNSSFLQSSHKLALEYYGACKVGERAIGGARSTRSLAQASPASDRTGTPTPRAP